MQHLSKSFGVVSANRLSSLWRSLEELAELGAIDPYQG